MAEVVMPVSNRADGIFLGSMENAIGKAQISDAPSQHETFEGRLTLQDALAALRASNEEKAIIYAGVHSTFIQSAVVKASSAGTWSVSVSCPKPHFVTVESPLNDTGTKTLRVAEPLAFSRYFAGWIGLTVIIKRLAYRDRQKFLSAKSMKESS